MTEPSALEVQLGPLRLRNPIVTASDTFGYGLEFTDFVDLSRLGGLCTKGLSLEPHAGNVPPRICETPAGMLNAIGLQNVGIGVFLREKLPRLRELNATVIANVWGDAEEDYVTVVEALEEAEGWPRSELNISSPQRRERGDALRQLSAGHGLARRPRPRGHAAAAHRQAVPQRAGPRPLGARRPRVGRRRALARQHVRGHGDRSGNRETAAFLRDGRALGAGDQAGRARDGACARARGALPGVPLGIGGIRNSPTCWNSWPRGPRPSRSGRRISGSRACPAGSWRSSAPGARRGGRRSQARRPRAPRRRRVELDAGAEG